MLYGVLNQRNPDYRAAEWSTMSDLYRGGFAMAANAGKYIRQNLGEPSQRYHERLHQASYINYFGAIIDSYAAALFQRDPILLPQSDQASSIDESFWNAFRDNADLRGNSFASVLRDAFLSALLKRRAIVGLDFPVTEKADSRAAEDASGAARAYAFNIDVEQLLDWEHSEVVRKTIDLADGKVDFELGRFEWCITKRCLARRASPEESRGSFVEEFKVWRITNGFASWELYRTKVYNSADGPNDTDDVPKVGDGITSFDCIPILELTLSDGMWLGNKLATLAVEHFQRRSALVAAENRALFAMPVAYLGPEVKAFKGEQASAAQQNPTRGLTLQQQYEARGFAVFGKDDRVEYLEPKGAAFEVVDRQLNELVDAMYRVTAQMAQGITASTTGLSRSGQSKQEDRHSMEVLLGAYAAIVSSFAVHVHSEIAEARKETCAWTVHGLDGYDQIDRSLLISEAKDLVGLSIPSGTFRAAYQTQLALDLLQCSPEEQGQIRKEIADFYAKNPETETPDVEDSTESEAEEPDDAEGPDAKTAAVAEA